MDNNEKITVLVVEPEKKPYVKEISNELSSLQHEVGGYIQAVYPFEEPVAIICDEEGKLNGGALNRALRDDEGHIYDIIAGTFLIAGLGDDDFASLQPDHIKKFTELYNTPEIFVNINGKLAVIPMKDEPVRKPSVMDKLEQLKADEKKSVLKKTHAKEAEL